MQKQNHKTVTSVIRQIAYILFLQIKLKISIVSFFIHRFLPKIIKNRPNIRPMEVYYD